MNGFFCLWLEEKIIVAEKLLYSEMRNSKLVHGIQLIEPEE